MSLPWQLVSPLRLTTSLLLIISQLMLQPQLMEVITNQPTISQLMVMSIPSTTALSRMWLSRLRCVCPLSRLCATPWSW